MPLVLRWDFHLKAFVKLIDYISLLGYQTFANITRHHTHILIHQVINDFLLCFRHFQCDFFLAFFSSILNDYLFRIIVHQTQTLFLLLDFLHCEDMSIYAVLLLLFLPWYWFYLWITQDFDDIPFGLYYWFSLEITSLTNELVNKLFGVLSWYGFIWFINTFQNYLIFGAHQCWLKFAMENSLASKIILYFGNRFIFIWDSDVSRIVNDILINGTFKFRLTFALVVFHIFLFVYIKARLLWELSQTFRPVDSLFEKSSYRWLWNFSSLLQRDRLLIQDRRILCQRFAFAVANR